jgi:hypothetical protein
MRAALGKLRDYAGEHEHWLAGLDEIAGYLNQVVGIRADSGTSVTPDTVRSWIKNRGLPVMRFRAVDRIRTTNLMLLAWCWSYATYQKEKKACRPR